MDGIGESRGTVEGPFSSTRGCTSECCTHKRDDVTSVNTSIAQHSMKRDKNGATVTELQKLKSDIL